MFPKVGMKSTSKLTGSLGENISLIGKVAIIQPTSMSTRKIINPKVQLQP
jgi:hypothetical protein